MPELTRPGTAAVPTRRHPAIASSSPPRGVFRFRRGAVAAQRANAVEVIGSRFVALLDHLGRISTIFGQALMAMLRRPFEFRAIVYQMESLGVRSVGIASVTAIFIGMVMAVQFAFGLQKFGGMEYTGRVVGLSFARELAPTLTAVIVGGRIGSGMTAEVGSMAVTEQIDAIYALGADPIKKLVVPRLVAVGPRDADPGHVRAGARLLGRDDRHQHPVQRLGGLLSEERARHRPDGRLLERHAASAPCSARSSPSWAATSASSRPAAPRASAARPRARWW